MAATTYIVKPGDTLSSVAKSHGISLNKLYEINPKFKTDPKFQGGSMIWAGTKVKIPAPTQTPPKSITTPPPNTTNPVTPTPETDNAPITASPSTPVDVFYYQESNMSTEITEQPPVKSAQIDTVNFSDEAVSRELLADLLFEDIAGQELLSIARNDTVNGQSIIYQPIKNLGILQETYNPTSLLRLQETSDKFFSNFLINLRTKIPKKGSGENGLNYYLDLETGDGIIEFVNLRLDEQVEVQIATGGIIEEVGI
jgi:LysM repeat protein